jgi:hypothetical protein
MCSKRQVWQLIKTTYGFSGVDTEGSKRDCERRVRKGSTQVNEDGVRYSIKPFGLTVTYEVIRK